MACHLRPATSLVSGKASFPGQMGAPAVIFRPRRMQLLSVRGGQNCLTAQSRCLDRPNAHARRLCIAAAKSVEALDEGVLPQSVSNA